MKVDDVLIKLTLEGRLVKCTRRYAILEFEGKQVKVMRGQPIVAPVQIFNIPALKDLAAN